MKLFKAYIKEKRIVFVTFLFFVLIFLLSFFLFRLPLKAVLYPAALCILFGIFIVIIDYGRVKIRHTELLRIQKLTADMITDLPETGSVYNDDYSAIINKLKTEVKKLKNDTSIKYRDMIDYYTVWAHQIKTPISSMRLTLQNDDSALSRTIMSDLFRIEQYVEMVLAFLRLDAESSDYVFRKYNINDIIKKSVKNFLPNLLTEKFLSTLSPATLKLLLTKNGLHL